MPCERQFFSRQGFLNTADCDGSNLKDYREHALGIIFHPVSHPGDAEIFARRISKKNFGRQIYALFLLRTCWRARFDSSPYIRKHACRILQRIQSLSTNGARCHNSFGEQGCRFLVPQQTVDVEV